MRSLLILLLALVWAIPAQAQTSAVSKLTWQQPLGPNQTYADVQGYLYTLQVDSATPVPVTATCVEGGTISCSAPLPTMTPGAHTLTLTATNGFGSASASPYRGGPPAAPITVTVTVTVTVQ